MTVDPGATYIADDTGCWEPFLSVNLDGIDLPSSELVISDETRAVRATYPDHLFERRSMTLRSASTWTAHPGDEVHLGWSHPGDFAANPPTVQFALNDGIAWAANASLVGDEVVFTVPPTASGSGGLRVGPPDATGDAIACGAVRCTFAVSLIDSHVLTITP